MKSSRVIAVNISLDFIEAFASVEAAVARCPGLEIAEGDWLFFDGAGQAMEAEFSEPAYIDTLRNVYGNGRYTLRSGKGKTLLEWLFDRCSEKDFWFGTLADFERRFT